MLNSLPPGYVVVRLPAGVEEEARSTAAKNAERFNALHPDAQQILNDPEFRAWVLASPIRTALLRRANEKFDVKAGDEVFSTWKALKGRQPQKERPQMNIVISVGLNVGRFEPAGQRERTIAVVTELLGANARPAETTGEWDSVRERGLQFAARWDADDVDGPTGLHERLAWAARALQQEAVAYIERGDSAWTLILSDGAYAHGGSVADYPVVG